MKSKLLILSMLFAGASVTANAQEAENYYTKKWTDNIFVGAGVGAMSTFNDGMNTTFNFNISVGKYITPVWGTRLQFGGFQQKIGKQKETQFAGDTTTALEFNLDGMLNLTNLIGGYNADRKLDVYVFAGPTLNIAKAWDQTVTFPEVEGDYDNGFTASGTQKSTYNGHGSKARIGATAGLGLAYNINEKWAINLEGRFGVTPSVFGAASDYSKAEGTGRLTIGAAYTFGGKKFAKVADRVVEKEVIKEIIKEVPVEVVKEVIKEIPGKASAAIFFKIGRATISPEGMVNVKVMAKNMKENPSATYKIAGFADKGTGSAKTNQTLSEKRAQAVFDALVAEGIAPERLEKVGMGGTDPMFEKAYLNRVVILETK